jgi:3-hydroxybutyryl-CoA dehydratase
MIKEGQKFQKEFLLSESIYNNFIESYKDKNPLHTDENFAREKGFKSIVMHGNILAGFLSNFIGECLPVKNVIIHSQEIKYHKPAYLNDALIFNAEVTGVYDSVRAIEFKFQFKNKSLETVAKGKIQIGII